MTKRPLLITKPNGEEPFSNLVPLLSTRIMQSRLLPYAPAAGRRKHLITPRGGRVKSSARCLLAQQATQPAPDATMIREQVQSLRQRVCTADAVAGGVP